MTDAEQRLLENGYEGVTILANYSYDSAVIGVTSDNQVVYDYELMVEWLMDTEGMTVDEAMACVDDTANGLAYAGTDHPLIMYKLLL